MSRLGKFEIQEQLGQGGMGVVYRAWDTKMERLVALKTISPDKATRADFLKRFRKEALSAGRLDHPNIVTVYEFDEQEDVCYIAMQFLEGSDLENLLISPRWEQEFTIFRRLDILIQVCRGLGYAHRHGVIHRDVKPANIIILADGTPKIVDFGIARLGEGTSATQGMVLGTAPYMAPEQIEGRLVDERVDVFAMGVVAYRMFARRFPFEANNISGILYKIVHDPPPPFSAHLADYPPELERIVLTALAKDRDQRYRTMEEMEFDIQGLLSSLNSSQVSSYVEEARRLLLEQDFTRAKEHLRKVLELEPGHSEATLLWQQVQKQVQQELNRRKVQALLDEGMEAYHQGHWAHALECFDHGLEVEPGHEMLVTYRSQTLREQAKSQTVAERLRAARELIERQDFSGARQCVREALDLNPESAEAQGFLKTLEEEQAGKEKRRNAQQCLERAQEALGVREYEEALRQVDQALALDPQSSQAARLRTVVQAKQGEAEGQKVRAEKIAAAQAALDRGDLSVALEHAQAGLEGSPNDPALQQLHTRARLGLRRTQDRKAEAAPPQEDIPTGAVREEALPPVSTPVAAAPQKAAEMPAQAKTPVKAAARPVVARPVAPLPKEQALAGKRRYALIAAALLAAILLGLFLAGKLRRPEGGGTPAAGTMARVRLDVAPWAEIKQVKNLSTGEVLKVSGQTPLEFELPPGEYRLLLSHPKFRDIAVPIQVTAGQVHELRRAFTQFDPAEVLKAYE